MLERLEERDVPTAVFAPHFGPETVSYHGGELLQDPPVYLIFWGPEWQTPGLSQLAADIQTQAASLLSGPYLSGLQQYSVPGHPISGHAHLGKVAFDSSVATSGFSQGQVEDVVDRQVDNGALPDSDDTSQAPIYVVLTPPSVQSDTPGVIGFHSHFTRFDFPFDIDGMHFAWVGDGGRGTVDAYMSIFSHEVAEAITDPNPESGFTSNQPGFPFTGSTEISDWEPEETFFGYTARVDGVLAQAYFSPADQAFIVPDGNSQKFLLTRNRGPGDIPLNTFTLTLNGDQRPGDPSDNLLLFTTSSGGVAFFLNGQTMQFDPGFITSVNVNMGNGTDGISVASTPSGVPVFITQGSNAATTIDVFPSGAGLFSGRVRSDVFFNAPPSGTGSENFSTSTLNVRDAFNNDPLAQTWTLSDNALTGKPLGTSRIHYTGLGNLNVFTNGSPNDFLVTGTDGAINTTLSTASNNDSFRVERTKAGTTLTINSAGGSNVTDVGGSSQTLDAVEGRVVVNGGGADTLHLFDQNSVRPNTVYTLDATSFTTPTTVVSYSGVRDLVVDGSAGVVNLTRSYNIQGLGATGTTTVNMKGLVNQVQVGSTNNNLDGFSPDRSSVLNFTGRLHLNGASSINRILINDSVNGRAGTRYTIAPGSFTRSVFPQFPVLFSTEVVISYSNGFGSSVEVHTASGGSTIQDNGTTDTMTVVAGSGIDTLTGPNLANTWGITALNQGSLVNLAFRGVENLVGGTGKDTFVFSAGAGVTGRIDGGTGTNTLSYARYTTDVSANLTLGKATGVGGGIAHINNLTGGRGNDVLVGDASDNVLIGGPGRNILIGGLGADVLNASTGGRGEDILIGGRTAFDGNPSALNLIKAEWSRPDTATSTYKTRVDHLMNGGGLNGTVRLNATTIFADGSKDLVTTSALPGLDLLGLDAADVLTRPLKPGEQVINV